MALTDDFKRVSGKIRNVADAIRDKTGLTEKLTIEQMAQEVAWLEGETDDTATYILVDENGNEIAAVATDEIVEIDGEADDVREGVTVVTGDGITVGTKEIPAYHTREGFRVVPNNREFVIPTTTHYDYTKLQAIICPYERTPQTSVSAEKISVEDKVYNVQSTEPLAEVLKDAGNLRIDLGIINESGKTYLIRYFMYKEIY